MLSNHGKYASLFSLLFSLLSRLLKKNRDYDSPIGGNECNRGCQFQFLAGCLLVLVAVTSVSYAQTGFVSLANFNGSADGASPLYGYSIVFNASGNGYGTTNAGGTYDQGTVFEVTPSGTLTTIYTFCSQINCADGADPYSGLVQGANGNFYGTTYSGGINGGGTVFEVTPAGLLTTLHSFAGTEGTGPIAGLVQASNGNFYGTTYTGGINGGGTVFEITPTGALTTLYSFCSLANCADGAYPGAVLFQATNGNLYGTTSYGGANDGGTVFQITPAGGLTTLYSFCSLANCADGEDPLAGLIQASNGNFYGTTAGGGANGNTGTIFEVSSAGLTTLYSFCSQANCADGVQPTAGLLQASDGNLYGTSGGGAGPNLAWSFGTVYGMTLAGQVTTLYNFCSLADCSDGAYPDGGLVESGSGILVGATSYGGSWLDGTVFTLPVGLTPAASRKTAANFAGIGHGPDLAAPTDLRLNGRAPMLPALSNPRIRAAGELARANKSTVKESAHVAAAHVSPQLTSVLDLYGANGALPTYNFLTQGNDGNLYGMTTGGGTYEQGTVFQLTPGGTLNTIYTFCSQTNCMDGIEPFSGLIEGANGNFYGTTSSGGTIGAGTVFEITSAGQLTTLYNFCSQPGCADGNYSRAGLVQASNGNLYGTTESGGAHDNAGTVFEITPAGQLTTLYSFCSQTNCTDGSDPVAGLVQASDGNLYGTTPFGGANGWGTIFRITLGGTLTTLYSFCSQTNCADGFDPIAALVQASDGNLYGTTQSSGGANGRGTIFRITLGGTLTTLYSFCSQSGCTDGAYPVSGLVQAGGNLYGTTDSGGANGYGTVFEITPAGQLTTIYSFDLTDGAYPEGGLVLASNGNLYGMTNFGGDRLGGTIFNLPPLISLSAPTGTAQLGVAYSSALVATGGTPPYTYSILSGSLPSGLLLNASTGAITGTPTMAGTFSFTAKVVDSNGNPATVICSIVVTSGTNPSITSLSLAPSSIPAGSVGPVVMSATVAPVSGSGTPTGTVAYFNGSTQVGTGTLSGGVANLSFNPSSLAPGLYSITAVYGGDNAFAGSTSQPQTLSITQTGPFAYVANLNSNTVSIISVPTGQVVNTIPVGPGPYGVAISPDGTQVYVSNNLGNDVAVIDTASSTVVATIPLQSAPSAMAFTPDGTAVYVVTGSSNSVSVINTTSQTVAATVPVQSNPVGVAMASTSIGVFAYVTNSGSNTVSVIAVGSNPTVVKTINVGAVPHGVAAAPNSSLVYVGNSAANTISAISVATNSVKTTIPVGAAPSHIAFTPDSSLAYVANTTSNTVSVIDTASSGVISTVTGLNSPKGVAITTDGSSAYVTNEGGNNVSIISTATNTITGTVAVGNAPIGVATGSSPTTTLQITQPLSPTQPNTFNFTTHSYGVQYPPGTQFSGVNMTVTAVEITQSQFRNRVAHTQFANANCIVYGGSGGNCVDYQVTCSDASGNSVPCPSESQPTIAVQTSFSTSQPIINPGFLTTPIGQNQWTNIFTGFSDPTVKGKTQGFSEFVAVDLGVTDAQGLAQLQILHPVFPVNLFMGHDVGIVVQLTSVATGKPFPKGEVSMSVEMIADANGNPTQEIVFEKKNCFKQKDAPGRYEYDLPAAEYAAGTYLVTIYGNSFPAYQGQFKILR
jgi:uncharacterized repeat protein (TIGR03803 family)/YVTN family beta-propeller protein